MPPQSTTDDPDYLPPIEQCRKIGNGELFVDKVIKIEKKTGKVKVYGLQGESDINVPKLNRSVQM